jgi:hypothetical protein
MTAAPYLGDAIPRLGIDIGRVIIGPVHEVDSQGNATHDTPFVHVSKITDEQNLNMPPAEGIWVYVPDLLAKFRRRGGDVWLVSKARSKRTRDLTIAWLAHHEFANRTGLGVDRIIFTDERKQKVEVCKLYGINHFIDDRVDCLEPMIGLVPVRVLFGKQGASALRWANDTGTLHAETWATAYQQLVWPEQYLPLRKTL